MKSKIEYPEITEEYEATPRISLVLPYTSKMKKQPELLNFLTSQADNVEKELLMDYPEERVVPVIKELRKLIKGVRCRSDGKSVGIFVSPVAAKVFYFTPSHLETYTLPVLVQPGA